MTLGGNAAHSWTRVATLVVQAGAILRAVTVQHTFRTTFGIRITAVLGQAGAGADAIAFLAHGISATRTRIAGLCNFWWHNYYAGREGKEHGKLGFSMGEKGSVAREPSYFVDYTLRMDHPHNHRGNGKWVYDYLQGMWWRCHTCPHMDPDSAN